MTLKTALLHTMSWTCGLIDRAPWLPGPLRDRLGCPTGLAFQAARLADKWGIPWTKET